MKDLETIAKHIKTLPFDIRAEVIVNDLLENNDLHEDQYVIRKEGQFTRAYRFDILDSQVVDYEYDSEQVLGLNLSRDSMYDMLPENIFHASISDSPSKEVEVMIKEHHVQKQQQKAARLFFQPFENELFNFGVRSERFEKQFLTEINGSKAADLFYQLWDFDRDIPSILISKFIRLLPFAYKIVGDIALASKMLSSILGENVEVVNRTHQTYVDDSQGVSLGDIRLGLDSITGSCYDDYSLHLDVHIGPLRNSVLSDYIHEGKTKKFIEMFYNYFFPIEVELKTIILLPESDQKMALSKTESSFLGYNTTL